MRKPEVEVPPSPNRTIGRFNSNLIEVDPTSFSITEVEGHLGEHEKMMTCGYYFENFEKTHYNFVIKLSFQKLRQERINIFFLGITLRNYRASYKITT